MPSLLLPTRPASPHSEGATNLPRLYGCPPARMRRKEHRIGRSLRPNTAGRRTNNAQINQGLTSEALIGPRLFRPAGRGGAARVRREVSARRASHPHALVSEPVSELGGAKGMVNACSGGRSRLNVFPPLTSRQQESNYAFLQCPAYGRYGTAEEEGRRGPGGKASISCCLLPVIEGLGRPVLESGQGGTHRPQQSLLAISMDCETAKMIFQEV